MALFALLTVCLIAPSFQLSLSILSGIIPSDDPDAHRDTCGIAIAKGYQCDNHTVTTSDGYILAIHRIYRNGGPAKKPVVFLQHGFEDSSTTWVINMPSQSLGFLAADRGMDVWMGNVRGNIYSRKHTTYSTTFLNSLIPSPYWNFTYNELAKYDLPTMVQYVLDTTGAPNLYYVGHSQGTMIGFIQFSEDPAWAQSRIKQFHALSPVTWLGHTTSPMRFATPLSGLAEYWPTLANTQLLADNPLAAPLGTILCPTLINTWVCTNLAMVYCGATMDKENKTRNSVYSAALPSGTSTINWLAQVNMMHTQKFETYGLNPTEYHPGNSLVPTYLYWSETDTFTQKADVDILKQNMNTIAGEHKQDNYNHLDFVWSLTAGQDIYAKLLNYIASDFSAS